MATPSVPERARRVTLRDIARHAGVSMTTVSFVLSGRRDMRIASATEERVLQSARQLGYRRRLSPRVAPIPGSPALALLSDAIGTEAFAGEMIRGVTAAAAERGHTVLMAESEGDPALEVAAVDSLLERGIDGFIYGVIDIRALSIPAGLRGRNVALLNCVDAAATLPSVIPDDYAAGRLAAVTLLEAGHTDRIWVAGTTPSDSFAGRRRLSGIGAALRAAGLALGGHLDCGWWPDASRGAMLSLLDEGGHQRPSAVIAMNDRTAMGIYQAAAATGLVIPDQLSVISFDNSDLARWMYPGLTSIMLPHFDMGRRAVELLFDATAARPTPPVSMPLTDRDSIAHPYTTRHSRSRTIHDLPKRARTPLS